MLEAEVQRLSHLEEEVQRLSQLVGGSSSKGKWRMPPDMDVEDLDSYYEEEDE